MARQWTAEERALLAPFVSDPDGDVYVVKGLPGIVGAAFARFSRTQEGFRETFVDEFIREGVLDPTRAETLLERVLNEYGDDSAAELEAVHAACENVSVAATKEIEDRRIGGSPIEKSTRYVYFDKPDRYGKWRYVVPDDVATIDHFSSFYISTMDHLFSTYHDLIAPMQELYRRRKPIEAAAYDVNGDKKNEKLADLTDEDEIKRFKFHYNTEIRTKTCDTLRCLLPLATKTNVGVLGNGRYWRHLLNHCYSHDMPEIRGFAQNLRTQLDTVIPAYVKRAQKQQYQIDVRRKMQLLANSIMWPITPAPQPRVMLLDDGADHIAAMLQGISLSGENLRGAMYQERDDRLVAAMLYTYSAHPYVQVLDTVRSLNPQLKEEIKRTYVGDRHNRRDRPGRALEWLSLFTFDCLTDFGTYKDLERHRMCTQLRQDFTPLLGFDMPADLEEAGFGDKVRECIDRAQQLYAELVTRFGAGTASYATLHGSHVRWMIGMNHRALEHMLELRTQPGGHPSYRRHCQEMHRLVAAASPWEAESMSFVNHDDVEWARAAELSRRAAKEAALDRKESALDKKGGGGTL